MFSSTESSEEDQCLALLCVRGREREIELFHFKLHLKRKSRGVPIMGAVCIFILSFVVQKFEAKDGGNMNL